MACAPLLTLLCALSASALHHSPHVLLGATSGVHAHSAPRFPSAAASSSPRAAAASPRAAAASPHIASAPAGAASWRHALVPALSYGSVGATALGAAAIAGSIGGGGVGCLVGGAVLLPTLFSLAQLAFLGDGAYVARAMGGRPADARLVALVGEVARQLRCPPPAAVFEIASPQLNAFAAGVKPTTSVIAVTSALRARLSEAELKAVLAHEMGHVLARDCASNTHMAAAIAGLGGVYAAGKALYASGGRRHDEEEEERAHALALLGVGLMGAGLLSQAGAHLLRLFFSRRHEFAADAVAARLYGAETMVAALSKIDAAAQGEGALGARGAAYAHMFISNPSALAASARRGIGGRAGAPWRWVRKALQLLSTHPTLEERVAALRRLKRAAA